MPFGDILEPGDVFLGQGDGEPLNLLVTIFHVSILC